MKTQYKHMNPFFSMNLGVATVVIITPRQSNRVQNPDTFFGQIGRRLTAHIRQELELCSTDQFPTQRLCLIDGCTETRLTYKDVFVPLQGQTPLKAFQFDTKSLLDIRKGIASERQNNPKSDTLFIITSNPFAFLVAVEEDIPTGNIPKDLPPLSALVVVNKSGKGVLKQVFNSATVSSP